MKATHLALVCAVLAASPALALAQQYGSSYTAYQPTAYQPMAYPSAGYQQAAYQQQAAAYQQQIAYQQQLSYQQAMTSQGGGDSGLSYPDAGGCQACQQGATDDCGTDGQCLDAGGHNPGVWYADIDLLLMTRDHPKPRTLLVDSATGIPVLSTNDLNFDFKPGPRLTVGYALGSGWGVESTYFGIYDWNARSTVNGTANISLPGDLGPGTVDFANADIVHVRYEDTFHNGELNIVHPYGDIRFLTGFRFVELEERLDINSMNVATGTSDYRVSTENRLYGGQIGAKTDFTIGRIGFNFVGKAGVYENFAHANTFLADQNNTVLLREDHPSSQDVAFIGEINASFSLPLYSIWRLRGGYNVMWIGSVSLAPNQLDFTNTAASSTGISPHDTLIMHGANIGLEARW